MLIARKCNQVAVYSSVCRARLNPQYPDSQVTWPLFAHVTSSPPALLLSYTPSDIVPQHHYPQDAIYNVVPSCASDNSTAQLNSLLSSGALSLNFSCAAVAPLYQPSAEAINELLYCGYRQVGRPSRP